MIVQIFEPDIKKAVARKILESLGEWFEVEESRERYISESADQVFFAAEEDNDYVGFLCLKRTGDVTAELSVMGVLKGYHRKGIGKSLFESAKRKAAEEGYSFLQVKTVRMGVYEVYDRTNLFYLSCGFREFEVIKEIWGEENPCQIYIMSLDN